MKKWILPLILVTFLVQGCVNNALDDNREHPKTLPRALTESEQQVIASGDAFSYQLFQNIVASDKGKNIFISPLSISMALGMTLNGAAGETQEAIKDALNLNELDLQVINQSYQSLIKLLVELDPQVKMNIGNSLWGREGFSINQSFKDTLQTYFNARADELNFDDPAAADVINDWVSGQTNGHIEQIVEGELPKDVVLYLINAIYFKGDWLSQFDRGDTRPKDFHLEDGSTVQVNMMQQRSPIATFRSDEVQMLEMPYGDSLYTMTVLMPADPEVPINDFVQESLTSSNLSDWTVQLQKNETTLQFPKFEYAYKKKLNDILIDMGMGAAFSDAQADFSNINPDVRLVISEVMHKANITVNEEGSEAAAVTSVGFGITSADAPFVVNRPFVFLIRERISGTVLFMGKMGNPDRNNLE